MRIHLKNLFIPHEGNGYKPRALHPGRLAFYAVTALVIKALFCAFIFYYPIEAWLSPEIEWQETGKMVSLSNSVRQTERCATLRESPVLARAAAFKAQDMLIEQYFAHVSPKNLGLSNWLSIAGYKFAVAGENLAMGFADADGVIEGWKNSPTHFSNLIDPDFTEIGIGMAGGTLNGKRTTVVVAMFASPQKASPAIAAAESKPAVSAEKVKSKPIVNNTENKSPIVKKMAVEKKAPEITPVKPVVSAKPENAVSDGELELLISAPGASLVEIFINGESVTSHKIASGTIIAEKLDLPEGAYEISVAAERGSVRIFSDKLYHTVIKRPPAIDQSRSYFSLQQSGEKSVSVISASVFLSSDVIKAELVYGGQKAELSPDAQDPRKWTGELAVDSGSTAGGSRTIVPAGVIATGPTGLSSSFDIFDPNAAPPEEGSLSDRYSALKNSQPPAVRQVYDISSLYFKIILLLAFLALGLNIFIEIRKQHPHMIASALGLIGLLVLLIVV